METIENQISAATEPPTSQINQYLEFKKKSKENFLLGELELEYQIYIYKYDGVDIKFTIIYYESDRISGNGTYVRPVIILYPTGFYKKLEYTGMPVQCFFRNWVRNYIDTSVRNTYIADWKTFKQVLINK